jgi:hypothetical protein
MSSTYSSNLRVELIGSGDQAGTWGTTTNNNSAYLFDTAIAGAISITIAGTPQALTAINGPTSTTAANQAVFATLKLVSAPSAFTLYAPPAAKQYIVWNATSYTATIGNATSLGGTTSTGGSTITLAAGEKAQIWSDNTNFYKVDTNLAFVTGTLAVANGGTGVTTSTGSGNNVLSSSPSLTSPTFTTPILGTPQSGNLANCTFPTLNQNTTGTAGGLSGQPLITVNDINCYRPSSPSTGVIYLGNIGAYVYFDGSSYQMPSYDLTVGGNVTAYSDERVKTNWRDLQPDFIEQLAQVKHGIYDRTDQDVTQVGVSAQSLQPVMANAVIEGKDGNLSVAYGNAALVAAIKLAERVVALEAKLAELTKE